MLAFLKSFSVNLTYSWHLFTSRESSFIENNAKNEEHILSVPKPFIETILLSNRDLLNESLMFRLCAREHRSWYRSEGRGWKPYRIQDI